MKKYLQTALEIIPGEGSKEGLWEGRIGKLWEIEGYEGMGSIERRDGV